MMTNQKLASRRHKELNMTYVLEITKPSYINLHLELKTLSSAIFLPIYMD